MIFIKCFTTQNYYPDIIDFKYAPLTYTLCTLTPPVGKTQIQVKIRVGLLGPKKDKFKVCSLLNKAPSNFGSSAAFRCQFCQALRYQNRSKGFVWHYINVDAMGCSLMLDSVGWQVKNSQKTLDVIYEWSLNTETTVSFYQYHKYMNFFKKDIKFNIVSIYLYRSHETAKFTA